MSTATGSSPSGASKLLCKRKVKFDISSLIFLCKIKLNFVLGGTLCQVRGCGACAANDPSIHSTEEIPFGDTRFMASPFIPTYFSGVESELQFMGDEIRTLEKFEVEASKPCRSISPMISPIFLDQVHEEQLDLRSQCSTTRSVPQHSSITAIQIVTLATNRGKIQKMYVKGSFGNYFESGFRFCFQNYNFKFVIE